MCDLAILQVTPTPPTSVGGFGYVTITFSTSAAYVYFAIDGPVSQYYGLVTTVGGAVYAHNLPAGTYTYSLTQQDDPGCVVTGDFIVPDAVPPVDPSLTDAPRWEPVGGVLPNPVLLKVEASLTDALGAARVGLHVEVELWRPAGAQAFARFRATVRTATQYVDAAPYLRAELVAAQRYAATSAVPLIDPDASLRFYYRYRVVDNTGAEAWLTRAGERYAVLAALPGATDTMLPYVANGAGRVASIFPEGEAVQALGYPLEASVLLPPATATRYAELRYLDAYGNEVEIRSFALASTLPAGMLRIPLPADALPCAAAVQVSVRTDSRAYVGTCGGTIIPVPPVPGALLSDHGHLLR